MDEGNKRNTNLELYFYFKNFSYTLSDMESYISNARKNQIISICWNIVQDGRSGSLDPLRCNKRRCTCFTLNFVTQCHCINLLYCPAQVSWLDFTALYRPLRCVTLSLLFLYEPKWRGMYMSQKKENFKGINYKLGSWMCRI